jgi:hypothetical protein
MRGAQSGDFHRGAGALAAELQPQFSFRLDAAALQARHYGEVACRDFRESVLAVLPHRWEPSRNPAKNPCPPCPLQHLLWAAQIPCIAGVRCTVLAAVPVRSNVSSCALQLFHVECKQPAWLA